MVYALSMLKSWLRLLALMPIALVCACKSSAAPAANACTLPTKVRLEATERINPDTAGEALPTVVRVYQLKEIVRVEESDFEAIWETPKETLQDDLVEVQEFTLFPGQAVSANVALVPSARYLVGVAIFRRPTGQQWRSVLPLPASARLCAAYEEKGAPDPAVVFRFDQYRVESKSRFFGASGEHDLPIDVAPDKSRKEVKKP